MRVFCPTPLDSQPIHQLFLFKFAPAAPIGGLFKDNLPENFFKKYVSYVESVSEADVIILPTNFVRLDENSRAYIARYAEMSEKLAKPIYAFSCGDHTDQLIFDSRVRVFRYSLYRSRLDAHDICTPTLTEDLGVGGVFMREKQALPTVSFCGKAGFATPREWIAAWLKRAPFELAGILTPSRRAHVRGVFWRIWALRACENSELVKTLFIVRKSFSGAMQTIELDPAQARKEFIDSVRNTDFVLAPKGDGNYSNRFLEALSMGRIPVLIDTDAVLPFEDKIDYSKICVKVSMDKVKDTPKYIREFYDSLTEEEWRKRQELARETFEQYLRQDSFFKAYFSAML